LRFFLLSAAPFFHSPSIATHRRGVWNSVVVCSHSFAHKKHHHLVMSLSSLIFHGLFLTFFFCLVIRNLTGSPSHVTHRWSCLAFPGISIPHLV
jgi:hypothetical protein